MENPLFPKELLEINWEIQSAPTKEFLSEEFLRKHSVSSKILNDEFTRVWSSDSDEDNGHKKVAPVKKSVYKKRTFDTRLLNSHKPFKAYPRMSKLTAIQQEVYLQLMKKFTANHSPFLNKQDQQDLQMYQVLQQKVASEQMEYLEFLREFAFSNQSRYSSINPNIKKYIDELWQSQFKSCLRYPQFYRAHRTVALVLDSSKSDRFDLIPGDVILEMGKLCRLDLDRKKLKINSEYSTFVLKHPIIDYGSTSSEQKAIIKCPVSQDQNAEAIAKKMNVDFILSSSGLKRICDNYPPFNKSWELPVTVKEIEIEENGQLIKKRVVFIDKALPRRRLTITDRILWFYKIAVKRHLVRPPNLPRNLITIDRDQRMKKAPQADENLFEDMYNVDDQESFGVEGPVYSESKFERRTSGESKSSKTVESEVKSSDPTIGSDSDKLEENLDSDSCANSDSDNENLVIDDPEVNNDTKNLRGCPSDSNIGREESVEMVAAVASGTGENESTCEDQSKPVTRHMAKMLENLNKVQEMVCKKRPNVDENLPKLKNLKLCSLENSDAASCRKLFGRDERNDELCGEKNVTIGGESGDSKMVKPKLSLLDKLLLGKDGVSDEKQQKPKQPHVEHGIEQGKSVFLPDYEPLPPPVDGNFVYRLFSLKKKEKMGHGFRLLIRCKLDAREFIHKPKPKTRIATIIPKLEFQPEFGAEAVTMSELTRNWLSVRIRPNSFLVRARINAFTSDIMMIEEREERDFYREEKYLSAQASCCLNTLHAVLNGVADLPPGQYILSHEPKMGAFASLHCATNEKMNGLYDLYKQYDVDPKMEEPQILSNMWIPVDFTIITPIQDMLNRVPGTFNPRFKNRLGKKRRMKNKSN